MSEWIVEREVLLDAIEVLGLVPSRPGIVTSEYILVKPGKSSIRLVLASEVYGFVDIKGSGKWPFPKNIYIDKRLFDPFVNAARNINSKSNFVFKKTGSNEITITNGTRRAKLTTAEPKQGYIEIDKSKHNEIKISSQTNKMLLAAKECAEQETAKPEISCVYVNKDQIYATTGELHFRAKSHKFKLKKAIPFPTFIINLVANDKLKSIGTTSIEVILNFVNGKVWQTIPVAAKKKFPQKQIDKWFAQQTKESKLAFVTKAEKFGTIVSRLVSYLNSVRRLDWVLTLKGRKGENKLDLIVPLGGHTQFKDRIRIENKVKKDFTVDWPLGKLFSILSVMASYDEKIYVHFDSKNRAYIKSGSIELLVSRRTN